MWVANTGHGPAAHWFARPDPTAADHDHLRDGDDAARYLADHRVAVPAVRPTPRQLERLAAIRGVVRDRAEGRDGWQPPLAALLGAARFRVTADGGIASIDTGWDAFADDLVVALVELVRRGDRVSVCANRACRLVFVDDSRNRSRRWCDNAGCGNRVRVRRYRATHDARTA